LGKSADPGMEISLVVENLMHFFQGWQAADGIEQRLFHGFRLLYVKLRGEK
jgi:hypothetical protein